MRLRQSPGTSRRIDLDAFVSDKFIRAAFMASGADYDAYLADYALSPLIENDAATGEPIRDTKRVAELWLKDESTVRHYASPEAAFEALANFEKQGKTARAAYAHDRITGIKLFADRAWFVVERSGQISAFLLRGEADAFAKRNHGQVRIFSEGKAMAVAN